MLSTKAMQAGEGGASVGHGHMRIQVLAQPKLNDQPEQVTQLSSLGWG